MKPQSTFRVVTVTRHAFAFRADRPAVLQELLMRCSAVAWASIIDQLDPIVENDDVATATKTRAGLEWKRPVTIGEDRYWFSRCGNYRVRWRKTYMSVGMTPAFIAQRLEHLGGDRMMWETVSRHKKLRTAKAACEKDAGMEPQINTDER